ncbi:hypothetical protein [Porphyromonas pogonae]|uniref:hypothetical protein n=1 Tax=Porphyromonas pogonae TaxID=867595 RepID=UPI002E7647F9|nr:hypothetical protein [Porphyromonas pogonae]
MKKNNRFLIALFALVALIPALISCGKNDDIKPPKAIDITYEVTVDKDKTDYEFRMKDGFYIDNNGKKVDFPAIGMELPWKVEFKKCDPNIKPQLKGYLFSIIGKRFAGKMVLIVKDSETGRIINRNIQDLDMTLGSGETFKDKFAFDLR